MCSILLAMTALRPRIGPGRSLCFHDPAMEPGLQKTVGAFGSDLPQRASETQAVRTDRLQVRAYWPPPLPGQEVLHHPNISITVVVNRSRKGDLPAIRMQTGSVPKPTLQ